MNGNTTWHGVVVGVQPRILLTRSFDQRIHSYLGYLLFVNGSVDGVSRETVVAIGKAAQTRHAFRVGDTVAGCAAPVANPQVEIAEFYKASKLKVVDRSAEPPASPPPWVGPPPDLSIYRQWQFLSDGSTAQATGRWDAESKTMTWTDRRPDGVTVITKASFPNPDLQLWTITGTDRSGNTVFELSGNSMPP